MEKPLGPCIEWQGSRNPAGYGHKYFRIGDKKVWKSPHRLEWERHHGPIPSGMFVLHRCDNRACYNIDHLFLGTQLDNMRDMVAKGRANTHRSLNSTQVAEVRAMLARGATNRVVSATMGVSTSIISRIRTGQMYVYVKKEAA